MEGARERILAVLTRFQKGEERKKRRKRCLALTWGKGKEGEGNSFAGQAGSKEAMLYHQRRKR